MLVGGMVARGSMVNFQRKTLPLGIRAGDVWVAGNQADEAASLQHFDAMQRKSQPFAQTWPSLFTATDERPLGSTTSSRRPVCGPHGNDKIRHAVTYLKFANGHARRP